MDPPRLAAVAFLLGIRMLGVGSGVHAGLRGEATALQEAFCHICLPQWPGQWRWRWGLRRSLEPNQWSHAPPAGLTLSPGAGGGALSSFRILTPALFCLFSPSFKRWVLELARLWSHPAIPLHSRARWVTISCCS